MGKCHQLLSQTARNSSRKLFSIRKSKILFKRDAGPEKCSRTRGHLIWWQWKIPNRNCPWLCVPSPLEPASDPASIYSCSNSHFRRILSLKTSPFILNIISLTHAPDSFSRAVTFFTLSWWRRKTAMASHSERIYENQWRMKLPIWADIMRFPYV